jgi:Pro-kumamolisin, activation domain
MQSSRSTSLSLPYLAALILSILTLPAISRAAAPDRIVTTPVSGRTVTLARSVHPKVQPQYDRGPLDPSRQLSSMSLVISPSPSQQQALDLLLAQQQDPKSPNYHKWLTPQQYADRFGLSQNDLNKITTWLKSQGFQIVSVAGGRNFIAFSGSVYQAERAFATEIHSFKVDGEEHFANSTPINIPSALSGVVTGVMGLHNFLPRPATRKRGAAAATNPRGNYYDAGFLFPNFLAPDDIATIYDIAPLYGASPAIDGTGQKLAIIGQTDVYQADINDFRSAFGLSTISCTTNSSDVITACSDPHFQYVLIQGPDPGAVSTCGDLSEADLDIEWSGAVARNAQIVYVNSPVTFSSDCSEISSGGGVNAALVAAINPPSGPPLAPVVSLSYGYCEIGAADLETYLKQGNAEGVTILNSSGDVGAAACDYNPPNNNQPFSPAVYGLAVSYPASSPEVTAVGGTAISLADDSYPNPSPYWSTTLGTNGGTAQSYIPELGWNDDVELSQFCQADSSRQFCQQGGNPAVGGWVPLTSTATAAQVQNDIWLSIGGGGASNCWYRNGNACLGAGAGPGGGGFAQPQYQQGLSVPNAPASVRYVPDVSLLASPDFPGYIFCTAQSEFVNGGNSDSTCASGITGALNNGTYVSVVGGTSVSTPVFAGIVTLLNQYVVENRLQTTPGLANINHNLYKIAAQSGNQSFHQVKNGNNLVYCQKGTPSGQPSGIQCPANGVFGYQASDVDAPTGYNLVTGLGSVDANALFADWASSLSPNFTIAVTPTSTLAGHNVTWNGTLTSVDGYSATVTLSCGAGAPSTCTISPSSLTPTSGAGAPFTVTVGSNTPGTYTFNIIGTDNTITNNLPETLTVNQDFTLATTLTDPPAANPGQSTWTTMQITPPGGSTFTFKVTYACSGLPAGATCSFFQPSIGAGGSAQAVTVTVQTAGPYSGSTGGIRRGQMIRKLTGQKHEPWVPLSLPLASIVMLGLAGGSIKRRYKIGAFAVALVLTALLIACGGGSGSSTPPATTVSPSTAQVQLGATQQFTASTAVSWSLSSGAPGSISIGGLYTAPTTGTTPASFTVTATPTGSGTAGTASVTIPSVGVTVSPSTVDTLYPNQSGAPAQQQQFTANVSNDSNNTAVTWAVIGGSANGTVDSNGLYTAPSTLPSPASVSVVATSTADTSKSGSATVNLGTPTPAGMYRVTVTVTEGTLQKTTTFNLTVN